jgi:hypothetical protein
VERQIVKLVDELDEAAARIRNDGSWRHVDEESLKVARTICDANPRAKNKRRTLRGY